MGTIFGFIVGYIVGAKSGSRGFDEVVQALRDVRDSEEFHGLIQAVRIHAGETVKDLGERLSIEGGEPLLNTEDLIAAARSRFRRSDGEADPT